MSQLSLLGSMSRVETPFIKVTIGKYTFGVYDKHTVSKYDEQGIYKLHRITYPNYIQSLQIKKINGQVNTYTLLIKYPITQGSDPNFFEKVFSSVSKTRKIVFSYGDVSVPNFIYKDEQAIITDVQTKMTAASSIIEYTVTAVSSAVLATSGTYNFFSTTDQPSKIIKKLLRENEKYGLQDIFFGMRDYDKVISDGLIPDSDQIVTIATKLNISVFDYLTYLVSCMIPASNVTNSDSMKSVYSIVVIDDTTGVYGGPYFKIVKADKTKDNLGAYTIDIGYPSQNIVTNFSVDNNEGYSILYDYSKTLHQDEYAYRINRQGQWEEVYSPIISSGNQYFETTSSDKTWWSKITEFPIKASITIKGLLRPAILMTHVRLNVYFYGNKHASSGLYIITQQQDNISGNDGFRTTLTLTRIAKDEDL